MTKEQLVRLMDKENINRYELAEFTGLNEVTIWRYMNGDLNIPKKNENLIRMSIASRKE